jgi:hypothetical protein
LTDKAKHAQKVKLPRASREGFDTMLDAAINGSAEPTPEQIYFLKVGISRDLVDTRNWWGKFQQLVEWAAPCQREAGLATLDGFISDALANPDLLRDMLGPQSDLAGALGSLVDFAKGDVERLRFPEQFSKEQQEFAPAHLNALMQRGALPDSAGTLLDRVCRQLDSAAPLARGDEAEQNEAFKGFLDKVLPDLDVLGGGDMAVALTNRQSRLLNKGGAAGLKEATSRIMPTLGDPGRKCAYLLSLAESRLGQDVLASDVQQHLDALLLNPNSVNAIVTDKLPPNRKMEKVTSIFYKIRDSALPDERKTKLVERLDELLASYIVEDKILDKLDNPDRPLHIRAFMLVSMCQPTMLPRGKAAKLAQQIIIRHLRRPNFEEELVSAIPEAAEKERILRKFHEELARSGFFG